ncbi:MAG: PDZ domain-containing protein [Rubrivivax sp.]
MVRPSLGVATGPPALARALGLEKGVPILQVMPGSPAQKAGLQAFSRGRNGDVVQGDVITAIDDQALDDADSLLGALERHQPGDKVTLSLTRAGQARKQAVTLGAPAEE